MFFFIWISERKLKDKTKARLREKERKNGGRNDRVRKLEGIVTMIQETHFFFFRRGQ